VAASIKAQVEVITSTGLFDCSAVCDSLFIADTIKLVRTYYICINYGVSINAAFFVG